jgi:chromosome segregation ATPase
LSRLQQDNTRLQQEKNDVEQKLKAADGELAKLKGEAGRLRKAAASLKSAEKDKADLRARLDASDAKLKETIQACREQIGGLQRSLGESQQALHKLQRESQQEVSTLQASVQQETGRANACESKNAQLYGVTMDLIARYKQNRGVWEKFLLSEPFTGLKAVEVENLLEDFREKAADARVPGAAAASATK